MKRLLLVIFMLVALVAPAAASAHHPFNASQPHWWHEPGVKAKPMFVTHFDDSSYRTLIPYPFEDYRLGVGSSSYPNANALQFFEFRAYAGAGGQPPSNLSFGSAVPEANDNGTTPTQANLVELFDWTGNECLAAGGLCDTAARAWVWWRYFYNSSNQVIFEATHITRAYVVFRIDIPSNYKKNVLGHEIGHTIGLAHAATGTGTWMEENPMASSAPNQHDYDVVNALMNHADQQTWNPAWYQNASNAECVKLGTCGSRGARTLEARTTCASYLKPTRKPACTLVLPGNPPRRVVEQFRRHALRSGMAFKRSLV